MDKSKLKNKIKEVEEQMEKLTLEHEEKIVENNELKEMIIRLEDSNKRQEEYMRSLGISLEEVIKENLKAKNVVFKGNNIDLSESTFTEDELVEEMTTINDSRKEV
ncbi:hypothetical protein DH26_gp077 [Chloriridovirus anopheles1]|uniref:Uncharacterized protein n=1 Tax=Chloriridovirus anopheles1 TaxID=1465751 RepID=W8QE50_9VIRU|nr:hypothetical protein DH26_gp077 [Anopheles minimus iridovirus]AHL67570.1 hypothetical protein AMIV_077 [Anopheles minimus iridovirus]